MAIVEEILEPDSGAPKVNNANLTDLKATSNDAIATYMNSRNYIQSHLLSDIRLGLGYAAVLSCAVAAYYEYKVGFKEAKSWSMLGIGLYFVFNVALYCWGYFIEGDTVYVGKKDNITVEISTSVKKYDPTYNVVIRAYRTGDVTNLAHVTVAKEFASWFNTEGTFVRKAFENWLGENVIKAEKQLISGKSKKKK